MRMPAGLRRLDDKVLGASGSRRTQSDSDPDSSADRQAGSARPPAAQERERTTRTTRGGDGPPARGGDGLSSALAVIWRVSRLVLLALGLVVLAAAALVLLPANDDNVIVRNVLSLAETVAGPFRDVFSVENPDRMRVYNYGLAAVVYFVLATVVGKLPTGSKKRG